jgi:FlaA1/EpsC-like NDP-sugar epimerase
MTDDPDRGLPGDTSGDPSASYDTWWRIVLVAVFDMLCWPFAEFFTLTVEKLPYLEWRVLDVTLLGMGYQLLVGFATALYRRRWLPFSFEELGMAALTTGLAGLMVMLTGYAVHGHPQGPVIWFTASAGMSVLAVRYARRMRARYRRTARARSRTPLIVIGAGDGGARAIRAMLTAADGQYRPVALLDDDPAKAHRRIMGVPMAGTTADLVRVAHAVHAKAVLVAIPSATPELLQRLHTVAQGAGLETLVLPPVQQLMGGGTTAEMRAYTDEDVLRRQVVKLDMTAVRQLIAGRRVLVTGAGGSIGSELSRQLAGFDPAVLVLVDHDDSLLHAVHRSLADRPGVHQELADIREPARLNEVFARHRPEVVFHAAALKHVPALESFPDEGWKTNVLGTRNVLVAAEAAGVQQFVNISTDKAADPVNVLGRTKRMAEQLTAAVAERTGQRYVSVRFGNVIGSRGSVMETFQYQIESGGPVTVTHPDVTRFFMAVREAVRLTLQAAAIGSPGEVLVLDMGAPVRILDVARQLIEQSRRPIEIVFTGLRPGEKLHEVLTAPGESASRPHHPLIDHVQVAPAWPELGNEYSPVVGDAAALRGYAVGDRSRNEEAGS